MATFSEDSKRKEEKEKVDGNMSFVQDGFSFVGMDTPLKRFVVLTSLGLGAEFFTKPKYAFDEKGNLRPLAIMSSEPGATYTPIGFFPSLVGGAAALFF